jgi:thiamine biosynthesis lipoprotein
MHAIPTGRHGPRRVEQIMGMPIAIDVRDQEVSPAVVEAAFAWLRSVDETFSTYKPTSEICRLNRGELADEELHPDVRAVLARCAELCDETGGYFDAWAAGARPARPGEVPRGAGAVDPSGLVKGWSVDRAALLLEEAGARNYAINAGGDMRVRGGPAPGLAWRVGIQHPLVPDKVAAVVPASNLAIATSGAYARGTHIVDPRSGRPPRGILSVTVTGPELGTADAYATAAFAMGPLGPHWVARLMGYEAMIIREDQTVLLTPGFPTERTA